MNVEYLESSPKIVNDFSFSVHCFLCDSFHSFFCISFFHLKFISIVTTPFSSPMDFLSGMFYVLGKGKELIFGVQVECHFLPHRLGKTFPIIKNVQIRDFPKIYVCVL
jgi:hypothetical protein